MSRHDLPSGAWVELREPDQTKQRDQAHRRLPTSQKTIEHVPAIELA